MERMDNPPHTILRPAPELSNNIHSMGHWRAKGRYSCRRIDISAIWEEMVRAHSWFVQRHGLHSSYPLPFRTLRRGKHRLLLWPGVEADGSLETATPSKLVTQDEMGRLEKVGVCQTYHASRRLTGA